MITLFHSPGNLKSLEDVKISEIFHCQGLLLCKTQDTSRLVVWNPSTHQTRFIRSKLRYTVDQKYFLGYENKNHSCFKILSLSCCRNNQNPVFEFEMYEFNSDSWRVLDVAATRNWFALCNFGVSLKGNTYWLDSDTEQGTLVNFIHRFDFTAERFERLPLPFESDDDDDLVAVLSVFREEKLAVLHQYVEDYKMKIWMTNNVTKTDDECKDLLWSEFLVVDFGELMVNSMMGVMSFLVDKENKRVMCCDIDDEDGGRTRIYIVGEDIHKQVYREMTYSPLLVSYVPSLVQIPATARR